MSNEDIVRELDSGSLVIEGLESRDQIQAGSVDLRLGEVFKFWKNDISTNEPVDPRKIDMSAFFDEVKINKGDYVTIKSGEKVKAMTMEYINLPNNIQAYIDGKSSWGRLDFVVHQTAGVIDAGFRGFVVLELENNSPIDMKIRVGDLICQMKFQYMKTPTTKPYQGRYQDQKDLMVSNLHKGEYVKKEGNDNEKEDV